MSALLTLPVYFVFASPEMFTRNLRQGDVGADVLRLQVLLNTNVTTRIVDSGPGSSGNETSYYGMLTADAVRRYQEVYRKEILIPAGLASGTGFFGPLTRVVANGSPDVDTPTTDTTSLEMTENVFVRPQIDSITPRSGGVGTKVTIHGEGFLPTGNTVG